jgi:hypothetical protein
MEVDGWFERCLLDEFQVPAFPDNFFAWVDDRIPENL